VTRLSHLAIAFLLVPAGSAAQDVPPASDLRIYDIIAAASPDRLEADIRTLAGFGTRNTLSDTLSDTRGIGAARRWIKDEMDRISADCGGCMEVYFQGAVQQGGRLPDPVNVVNVVGVIRGTVHPNRYVRRRRRARGQRQRLRHGRSDRGRAHPHPIPLSHQRGARGAVR
jgi:hypothetical protein